MQQKCGLGLLALLLAFNTACLGGQEGEEGRPDTDVGSQPPASAATGGGVSGSDPDAGSEFDGTTDGENSDTDGSATAPGTTDTGLPDGLTGTSDTSPTAGDDDTALLTDTGGPTDADGVVDVPDEAPSRGWVAELLALLGL